MSSPRWSRALVTGASSGIGEQFVRQLATDGTDLVLVARSGDVLQALAVELGEAHGIRAEVLVADLTEEIDLAAVEARLRDDEAPIDLLVNNAGFGTAGRFVDLDAAREQRQISLNVAALVRLTHAALPGMKARGAGGICNVASLAGFQPTPFMATYGATKAFVCSFTQAVHEEVRGRGVHVSCLAPGFTRTEFQAVADAEDATSRLPEMAWQDAPEVAAAGLAGVAANRALVVPGLANRMTGALSQVVPSAVSRRIVALAGRLSS